MTIIRCIVAASNGNGEPDLYFVKVRATQAQIDNAEHYYAARNAAANEGYEPKIAFDETDSGGKAMLGLFEWESASIVDA